MPRLSLWRPGKTNDFKYLDRIIREQYTVGGLDIHIHKYLGPKVTTNPGCDATLPSHDETNPLFIEDLLFLENRNRDYEEDVYVQRGVYRQQDIDFDLSQFGLFLQNDTLFITFHYNDMIDHIGRKLMNGDVLEFPNLRDFHPLDQSIPTALPKFYVINDANFAAEGFSQTWLPHLWRVKAVPLVGGQEYQDILDDYMDNDGDIDGDDGTGNGKGTLSDYICQYNKNIEINDSLLAQAEVDVPLSGYDISKFYIVSYDGENGTGEPVNWPGLGVDTGAITADLEGILTDKLSDACPPQFIMIGGPSVDSTYPTADTSYIATTFDINATTYDASTTLTTFDGVTIGVTVDMDTITVDRDIVSPGGGGGGGGVSGPGNGFQLGYLVGDGLAPNGWPVTPGTSFPVDPTDGEYVLCLDYLPNRLFRYDGNNWIKIEDDVRTDIYMNGGTQRAEFFNNTDTISTPDRGDLPSRQALSDLLRPKEDN